MSMKKMSSRWMTVTVTATVRTTTAVTMEWSSRGTRRRKKTSKKGRSGWSNQTGCRWKREVTRPALWSGYAGTYLLLGIRSGRREHDARKTLWSDSGSGHRVFDHGMRWNEMV